MEALIIEKKIIARTAKSMIVIKTININSRLRAIKNTDSSSTSNTGSSVARELAQPIITRVNGHAI